MTTKGVILEQAAPSTTRVEPDGSGANPPLMPETESEQGMWEKASPWVHGVLGVASFVPGLSVVTGALDAAIYTAEGELVEAGVAAASMIPGGKVVTTAGKAVKGAVGMARGTGTVAKVVKGADEGADLVRTAREAVRTAGGGRRGGKNTTIKRREKGPCDHLRQGSGKGHYRGGAHGKTSKPKNDQKDSHHMPADNISPLKKKEGPAIQMDPDDHAMTSSNGKKGARATRYRHQIEKLLIDKKWREAMLKEIRDVRNIARAINDPRKYNQAMLEMLEYFKCLQQNDLLP
ncbi:hypothetical protein [Massilia oculi]|uniref:hypothetical protein n=1 Tax=Massilia oculi TaxID=945844 RepID=UPI0028A96B11|nr:hypothetical protein [Massilia oculi]